MADLSIETTVQTQTNLLHIAGLDEAGRGALAGPVVAAAVILPLNNPKALAQLAAVNDSKQLSPITRSALSAHITQYALAYGIGLATADCIDEIGIIAATKQAMCAAVAQLSPAAEYLLVDGRICLTTLNLPQQAIIRGDAQSVSIAAASILAKVTRDQFMIELDGRYPTYGFAQHKGYGTPQHLAALQNSGPCPLHRRSFAPLRQTLENNEL
ncbi:MAG: ribonuclease HII [Chloroflexi bacterium]|nr:ribonuclease HII [Chloroflexota bacterium]